jgi:hypothetical protein
MNCARLHEDVGPLLSLVAESQSVLLWMSLNQTQQLLLYPDSILDKRWTTLRSRMAVRPHIPKLDACRTCPFWNTFPKQIEATGPTRHLVAGSNSVLRLRLRDLSVSLQM